MFVRAIRNQPRLVSHLRFISTVDPTTVSLKVELPGFCLFHSFLL